MLKKIKKQFSLPPFTFRLHEGFTLIELLIYLAIFAVISVVTVDLFVTVAKGYSQSEAAGEVQQNLRYSMERISGTIRAATGVNSASGSTLDLAMPNPAQNPTIFDLSSGVLRIKEGSGIAKAITSDKVIVDSLTFTAINNPSPAKATVQVNISMSYNNQGNPDYTFSASNRTTVSLRQ